MSRKSAKPLPVIYERINPMDAHSSLSHTVSSGAALLLSLTCLTACGQEAQTASPLTGSSEPASAVSDKPEAQPDAEQSGSAPEPDSPDSTPESAVSTQALPELVHCTAKEIIEKMGGQYELFTDEAVGYFYFTNEQVFPKTRFYFCDTAFENIGYDESELAAAEPEIRNMLLTSGIQIDKINTYAGGYAIDGYEAGRHYSDYEDKLGSKSFSFGNLGEYFCGAPASSACSFSVPECSAKVTLHFELTGDYEAKEKQIFASGCFSSDLMHSENPALSVLTVERTDGYPKAVFTEASASSELPDAETEGAVHTYIAANVLDGDPNTCWCEGISGLGYGESITLKADQPQTVTSITVLGGLRTDEGRFQRNARPTKLLAKFDDGSVYTVLVSDRFDDNGYSVFLCSGKQTASIEFSLCDITAGTSYEDTCISEIRFE